VAFILWRKDVCISVIDIWLTYFTRIEPSRTYAQYDLAALVSVPDIDEAMTDALASVDKSMYPSVTPRELSTITSDYPKENIFYTDGSMIDDVTGFAELIQNDLGSSEFQYVCV
jgi:hypothetical protein